MSVVRQAIKDAVGTAAVLRRAARSYAQKGKLPSFGREDPFAEIFGRDGIAQILGSNDFTAIIIQAANDQEVPNHPAAEPTRRPARVLTHG